MYSINQSRLIQVDKPQRDIVILPLKTAIVWGLRNTSDPISTVSFTFTMRRHLIRRRRIAV